MFDLAAKDGSVRPRQGGGRTSVPIAVKSAKLDHADDRSYGMDPHTAMDQPDGGRPDKLDSGAMQSLHRQILACYSDELDRQSENRDQMAEDENFYDNMQWSEEDAATLKERGQVPLVYNVISTTVDWITGTEKRARTDFKVLARRKQEGKPAEKKTALMKYLSDVNREAFAISRAFEDACKVGIGWIEDGYDAEGDEEPLYSRYESWRNVLHDSAATTLDVNDARYIFRTKWLDLDVAVAMFPHRADLLRQSAVTSEDFIQRDLFGDPPMDSQEEMLNQTNTSRSRQRVVTGFERRRVRVIEGWYKKPVMTGKLKGGQFSGEIFDAFSEGHKGSIADGSAIIVERTTMRMHVCLFTEVGFLWFSESPFRHNRFPFTPIWAYRRGKDGQPYGVIRRLKDIQIDINKRASKALHILSTAKIIMDFDALPDDMTMDEFLEEASRPDAVLRIKPGKRLDLNVDRDLSQWHLELMSRSIAMVQQASGVTDELLGRKTNATSGVAIQRRQDQGTLATAKLFDNLLFASQVHGEKLLANIEQFMDEEKQFRITNMRGTPEYIEVNTGLPEDDITRTKADFIISESAWHASSRQAAADELLEAMNGMPPEVAIMMLDLVVENMDLPNREEIVKRIRSVTGMRDPDQTEPTPEDVAKAQAQQEAQQFQKAMLMAQLKKLLADAEKAASDAEKSRAAAEETAAKIATVNVDSQQKALEAAATAIAVPSATKVADYILAESGFVSQSDKDAAMQQAVASAQQQRAAAAQQPGIATQAPQAPQAPAPNGAAGPPAQLGLMQ